jgi:hypothetical protein
MSQKVFYSLMGEILISAKLRLYRVLTATAHITKICQLLPKEIKFPRAKKAPRDDERERKRGLFLTSPSLTGLITFDLIVPPCLPAVELPKCAKGL